MVTHIISDLTPLFLIIIIVSYPALVQYVEESYKNVKLAYIWALLIVVFTILFFYGFFSAQ